MLHKSLEELAQTEGGKTAIKIIKQNKIVQICYYIFIWMLFCCYLALTYNGSRMAFYVFMALGLILAIGIRTYYNRIHWSLIKECNPFKAEEVYTYYYLAYAKKKLKLSVKWFYHLYISRSVMLQGDFERAFFILNQIYRKELDSAKQSLICLFHQNMRIYYCYKNDTVVLNDMRNYFIRMLKDSRIRRTYRNVIKKEIEMIDLHVSLDRGDFSVYDNLSRQRGWTRGSKLQRVSKRWTDAVVHNMQNNQEAVRLDCQYVIENGNRLYYVEAAKALSEKIPREIIV